LGFSWVFKGVTKYFKFTVLPFGLSLGPYIFSKVMRPLVKYWRSKAPSIVVYLDDADASAVGCAAFISMNDRPVSHKNWDAIEIKQSSTWRELMSVKHSLQSFVHFLKGGHVKWYTDNQGVAAIVKSGSAKGHLHKLAMEIFSLSKEHDVRIDIEWIPRSENEVADYLSKIVYFEDWSVKILIFRLLIPLGGPLQLTVLLIPLILKFPGLFVVFSTWEFACRFVSLRLGSEKFLACSLGLFNSSCTNAFS